jgi:hypothetical protein
VPVKLSITLIILANLFLRSVVKFAHPVAIL